MQSAKVFKAALFLSISVGLVGAIFKIMHWPMANGILTLSLAFTLIYIVIALSEIFTDRSKPALEKLLWLIGFLFMSLITAFIYYFVEMKPRHRKRELDRMRHGN